MTSSQRRPAVSSRPGPLAPLLGLTLIALVWGACSGDDETPAATTPPDVTTATPFRLPDRAPTELPLPIRIAVTLPIFEQFAREAGRENVEAFSLIPPGNDPHSYQFTDSDVAKMKGAFFFFLNGLGLDSRLQDTIESNRDEASYVIPFAPNIRSPQDGDRTAEQAGDNSHLWLDPSLAAVYVEIVADELVIYDGVRKEFYDANFNEFKVRMLDLQDELNQQLQPLPPDRRKLLTYHNSFDHFARRFGLQIAGYAADVPGGEEPGAADRLVQIVRGQGLPAVFAEYGYDATLMQEVADKAGVRLCTLYSDMPGPGMDSYEEMMRANAAEIVRCLGG